ncbi:hypothetical protein ORV05_03720 [Amycolatopsis cynarae]|uniref:Uncharacterized protein n=1 Tax=Amycolatopsis cynarae TaxID=2995223 RepID=A0ABY7B3M7_9PSEU|nr:hypothetical protein [Amycolatopsis sp. HUAS 11-8]WAL66919.1 hypothetical protein ORV05_03720 [Amycolatopsis sp. HUAS 11-8]
MEEAFGCHDITGAARLLGAAPGLLLRNLDRLLRAAAQDTETAILEALIAAAPNVAGRVLLSVREHLVDRADRDGTKRVFTNRRGRSWVADENRPPLSRALVADVCAVIDAEITRRLAGMVEGTLLVDPEILGVALPLSGKTSPRGMGVVPRGSMQRVSGEVLSFFVHWRQSELTTDYDLSTSLLDANFGEVGYLAYTRLRHGGRNGAVHSGDVVEAADGASEFIDVPLAHLKACFIVPQVLLFSGEPFHRAEEVFFGYQTRDRAQKGEPYEARTVRAKSDLAGGGRVAYPVIFLRGDDGTWWAKWLHLYAKGRSGMNTLEGTRPTTGLLARGVVERRYLTFGYLVSLAGKHARVEYYTGQETTGAVTYLGWDRPDGLPEGARVITIDNLVEMIPE